MQVIRSRPSDVDDKTHKQQTVEGKNSITQAKVQIKLEGFKNV